MKEMYFTLSEASLNNHCPQCFSMEGLTLTFKQKLIKSTWSVRRTEDVQSKLFCKKCDQQIYPVDWDLDIERVYEYHRKATPPKPTYFKPTKNLWFILILIIIAVVGAATYVILN